MDNQRGVDFVRRHFDETSEEQWFEQIIRDLKGKSVTDVSWDFDGELAISPFAPKDDSCLPTEVGFNPTWEIAEEFDVKNAAKANIAILEALNGGCETLLLQIQDVPDWDFLFEGVDLGIIRTYVIPEEGIMEATIQSLKDWTANRPSSSDFEIMVRGAQNSIAGPAHTEASLTVTDVMVRTINQGLALLDNGYREETLECTVDLSNNYLIEIARLRALRILWSNVLRATTLDTPTLLVETRFAPIAMSDDPHKNMITAATKALAAVCGGADRIVIAPSSSDADGFSRRISRNVHHLLRYESKLDTIPDPVAGSWYIEGLCREIVQNCWKRLIKE